MCCLVVSGRQQACQPLARGTCLLPVPGRLPPPDANAGAGTVWPWTSRPISYLTYNIRRRTNPQLIFCTIAYAGRLSEDSCGNAE